ncbi:hypothetical protein NDU88_002040 [Pleurodeles waltl]|uniref:Uncharacterized protein n=1 Tax=Pleurodeles waltl TaxID=8319 RepID=A0AAV7KRN8_PLEWA|nr:hypothetical protein NDU88_002040 [Pleurodeles waltl]
MAQAAQRRHLTAPRADQSRRILLFLQLFTSTLRATDPLLQEVAAWPSSSYFGPSGSHWAAPKTTRLSLGHGAQAAHRYCALSPPPPGPLPLRPGVCRRILSFKLRLSPPQSGPGPTVRAPHCLSGPPADPRASPASTPGRSARPQDAASASELPGTFKERGTAVPLS